MSAPDPLARFVRHVRATIRKEVAKTREPPALSLWVSHQASARRCAHVPIGAAEDAAGVAANVREGVVTAWARYAAIGRLLADTRTQLGPEPGAFGTPFTTTFGLVVAGERDGSLAWEAYAAPIVAGDVGAWAQTHGPDVEWARPVSELLLSCLRDVAGRVRTCPTCEGKARAVVCPTCGAGGRS